jgi:CheY-like chemotaxis protein
MAMATGTKPVFLYIDDDAMGREIMGMLLASQGYSQHTIFEDSSDFLDRVEALSPHPDVFFLDVHVEPYNGFDMLAMLRANPTFGEKIIVAVTASVMNEEVAQLKNAGFNGAIGKPLDFDNFGSLVEAILAGKEVWYVL